MADLDGDGLTDVLSGSWPGELYLFRRAPAGTFRAGEVINDRAGKPLDVGHATAAFADDWDGDGDLDLVVGNLLGEVYLIPNEGAARAFAFGVPKPLEASGAPIRLADGDAAPAVADWDGDGRLDLLVGTGAGSVLLYRNLANAGAARLAAAETLVEPSPIGLADDARRRPRQWGIQAKPCAIDWDGDGRLDLLLGDACGHFRDKPRQTPDEQAAETRAADVLPDLNQQWAAAFRRYRALLSAPEPTADPDRRTRAEHLSALRSTMVRLKDEIAEAQRLQILYRPQDQHHGFVWLFRRVGREAGR